MALTSYEQLKLYSSLVATGLPTFNMAHLINNIGEHKMKYKGTNKEIEVGDNVVYNGQVTTVFKIRDRSVGMYPDVYFSNSEMAEFKIDFNNLIYIATTLQPHKHRDLIIAWAKGAEIEAGNGQWWGAFNYKWDNVPAGVELRIKPSKSPKQLEKDRIQKEMEKLAKELEELEV
jgi:hypothetical protein